MCVSRLVRPQVFCLCCRRVSPRRQRSSCCWTLMSQKYDQAVFLCIGRSRMLFVPRINEFSFDCTMRDSTFQRIPEDMIELNDVLHAGYCFRLIDDSMFHILKLRRLTCVVILTAAAFLFFFFFWQIGRWGSHLVVFVFYSKAQVTNSIVCVPAADAVCRYKRQLLQEQ